MVAGSVGPPPHARRGEGEQVVCSSDAATATNVITVLTSSSSSVPLIYKVYGFYDECQRKYGNANAWRYTALMFLITLHFQQSLMAKSFGKIICRGQGVQHRATLRQRHRACLPWPAHKERNSYLGKKEDWYADHQASV
ncbi:unnamed protein product [Urochloa humidicola]